MVSQVCSRHNKKTDTEADSMFIEAITSFRRCYSVVLTRKWRESSCHVSFPLLENTFSQGNRPQVGSEKGSYHGQETKQLQEENLRGLVNSVPVPTLSSIKTVNLNFQLYTGMF